jgi:HD-like signal output (HDOD) protein
MSVVKKVLRYLDSQGISYSVGKAESNQTSVYRVETALLKDAQGVVLATYPASQGIDLSAIRQITHRKLGFAEQQDITTTLTDIEFPYILPLGSVWGLQTLVEKALFSWPCIEFNLNNEHFLHIDASNYSRLFPGRRGFKFAHDSECEDAKMNSSKVSQEQVNDLLNDADGSKGISQLFNQENVITRIETAKALPVMPGIVHQLLRLLGNEDANISDLVEIIEQDQALVARVISLSRSVHYAYHGNIANVFDAVYRVIGYEDTLRIALAMIFSRQLQGPLEGRVGLKELWVEAMTVAMASRYIALKSNLGQHLNPGVMYVAALLHNIGYLALAHLFPREYAIFNRMVTTMSDTRLSDLESGMLEISPLSLSSRVLDYWNMPGEAIAVATVAYTQEKVPDFQAYCDCYSIARNLMFDHGDDVIYPQYVKDIASRYGLDLEKLLEGIVEEKVAAEIPFVVDLMLA